MTPALDAPLAAPTERRWQAATIPEAATGLAAAGLSPLLAALLAGRGITTATAAERFLAPGRATLVDTGALPGFEAFVERLLRSARSGEQVVVVGDYDVDGITAAALVSTALRAAGARVTTHLPSRDGEGYGLQPVHLEQAAAAGATLLVAVDSGTSALEAGEAARRLGVDLAILDHHLPGESLPDAVALLNPHLDPGAPGQELTAAGLALFVAAALLEGGGREVPWESLARLAALGTIADVAPLVDSNRALVALGLEALGKPRSAGLRALLAAASVRGRVRASDVAFRLAPRLNAAGRLGSPEPALELLLTRDAARARELAGQLDAANSERQRIEERHLDGARRQLDARGELPSIVVLAAPDWHRGVVGIAAARLARELHRPTLLFAADGELAVGSGRSVAGIALHDFLRPWGDRCERFGGHAQAVGLTVRSERIEALRAEWEQAAERWRETLSVRTLRYDLELPLAEVTESLATELDRLEPFGAGNPEPLFRFGPARLAAAPREFGRGHVELAIRGAQTSADEARNAPVSVVAWRRSASELPLDGPFELLAAVERDHRARVRLRLVDLRPLEPSKP